MTDATRLHDYPSGRKTTPVQSDFELIESYGGADANDQDAFDRALDALLPQEAKNAPEGGASVDIDLDDFEAFNRELDARLAEARIPPAENAVEDLGTEIIPAPPPMTPPADEPVACAGVEDLPDDLVTLGAAGVAATAAASAPSPSPRPAPAPAAGASAVPGARRAGGGWALALGIAGLLAGTTSLWLNRASQGELARLQGILAVSTTAAAPKTPSTSPAAPSVAPELERLDAKVSELARAVEALTAAARDGTVSATDTLDRLEQRLARAEAQLALAKATATAGNASAPEPAMPVIQPTPAMVKAPAGAGPKAVATAEPAKPAAPTIAAAPEPSKPAADKPKPAPEPPPPATTATAPKAKKPLPNAAGGAWAVVVESFATEADAYKRLNRVENAGLVADVIPAQINNQTWHRVVVPGYASQDEAKTIAAELKGRGLGQPWVYQRKSD
jgi:hypothetical protein